jgi:L,D-peptidoglycan transpeptidase YkuD (ErfK/YbiS/YcfS/YnhG family)
MTLCRTRWALTLLLGVLAASLLAGLLPSAPATAAAAPRGSFPTLGEARQAILVTPSSRGVSWARLSAWEKVGGRWQQRFPAVAARIGSRGFAPAATRRQNTGTTPAGVFALPKAFGSLANPGTRMPYKRFDRNDWWVYDPRDPKTYNTFQLSRGATARWRTIWAEHLWRYAVDGQYKEAVVIGYNLPTGVRYAGGQFVTPTPADTRGGGGIFLHALGKTATAGCVAVPLPYLTKLLRWLDPAKSPRIVMGPGARLT